MENDEYTDEALNQEYYIRSIRLDSRSEGCRAYVKYGYHTSATKSKYRDANWMK